MAFSGQAKASDNAPPTSSEGDFSLLPLFDQPYSNIDVPNLAVEHKVT
jgi:hypothetical protein